MTCRKFEETVGYHCSPVIMGLKPSNLVSFSKEKAPSVPKLIQDYTEKFQKEGICFQIICGCRRHYLVLVYRPELLEAWLKKKEVKNILKEDGYPAEGSLETLLGHLEKRFETSREFPHEIGLFLGYPLEDVKGFRKNKGNGCKLCGYWKVYGDAEKAKETFARFDQCRDFVGRQIQAGYSLLQMPDMKHLCNC